MGAAEALRNGHVDTARIGRQPTGRSQCFGFGSGPVVDQGFDLGTEGPERLDGQPDTVQALGGDQIRPAPLVIRVRWLEHDTVGFLETQQSSVTSRRILRGIHASGNHIARSQRVIPPTVSIEIVPGLRLDPVARDLTAFEWDIHIDVGVWVAEFEAADRASDESFTLGIERNEAVVCSQRHRYSEACDQSESPAGSTHVQPLTRRNPALCVIHWLTPGCARSTMRLPSLRAGAPPCPSRRESARRRR